MQKQKWQSKTDDSNNWHRKVTRWNGFRDRGDQGNSLGTSSLKPEWHLGAARQGEHRKAGLGAGKQCQTESLINRRGQKIVMNNDSLRASGKWGVLLLLFLFLLPSLKFASSLLFFWRSSDRQVGSVPPLMIPVIALFMITQTNLTIYQELDSCCHIPEFGMQTCLDSRPRESSEVTPTQNSDKWKNE